MSAEIFGYAKNYCAENGGVDEVIIYDMERVSTLTFANNIVSALTLEDSYKAYRIITDMESSNFTDVSTRSRANNSKMVAQTGLIIVKDYDLATVQLVEQLSLAYLGMIAKFSMADGTSKWHHYGLLNGMTMTTGESTIGQLYEDLRGTTLNFEGKELTKAPEVDNAIVQALLTPTS